MRVEWNPGDDLVAVELWSLPARVCDGGREGERRRMVDLCVADQAHVLRTSLTLVCHRTGVVVVWYRIDRSCASGGAGGGVLMTMTYVSSF